jgi:arylsulfatase A-like enzyme
LSVVTLAVWFGLLAGLTEAILISVKKLALGHLVRVSRDVVWMAPLADTLYMLVPAMGLAFLARWRSALPLWRSAVAVFAFLALLAVLLPYWNVALYAKALVVAGLAIQAARLLAKRRQTFDRLVIRTLPALVAAVVVLTAGVYGWRWLSYRQSTAALPAASLDAPNVLLVVLDTVRAQNLSLYGYARQTTPTLDKWAARAAVFDQAIAPSPWTFPSHATIFTGRWPHELAIDWHQPLGRRFPTLAEVLRDRGYATAGFAANLFYCTTEYGLDRGFLHYDDYPASPSQIAMSTSIGRELISFSLNQDPAFHFRALVGYDEIPGRRSAADINAAFLAWQARQDPSRPFFAFLNYLDAHQPFLPPAPFDTKFRGDAPRGDPRHWWDREWTPEAIQAEVDAYDGAIAYLDHQIGLLFDELNRRGALDDTIVVVTSDHGEHFGEHGFMRHSNTLYREVLHVPLMIVYPARITQAIRVPEPVTLRDIPATVLDLAGEQCPGCVPGRPLTRQWKPEPPGTEPGMPPSPIFAEVRQGIRIPERYPAAKGDMQSWIADGLQFIVNGDGTEELYDLLADPRQADNLAARPEGAERRDRMKSALEAFMARRSAMPPAGPGGR